MRPLLCKNCAFKSEDDKKVLICKMCRVTEKMRNFDVEQEGVEIDTTHAIKMVASVSYDRTKKQFNYDNFHKDAFEGAHNFEELKKK